MILFRLKYLRMHEINKKLKNLRRQKKYTQAYIADRLGVTTRAYSKIENGETNLTIEKLYRITDILDVHLSHLFDSDIVIKNNSRNNTPIANKIIRKRLFY